LHPPAAVLHTVCHTVIRARYRLTLHARSCVYAFSHLRVRSSGCVAHFPHTHYTFGSLVTRSRWLVTRYSYHGCIQFGSTPRSHYRGFTPFRVTRTLPCLRLRAHGSFTPVAHLPLLTPPVHRGSPPPRLFTGYHVHAALHIPTAPRFYLRSHGYTVLVHAGFLFCTTARLRFAFAVFGFTVLRFAVGYTRGYYTVCHGFYMRSGWFYRTGFCRSATCTTTYCVWLPRFCTVARVLHLHRTARLRLLPLPHAPRFTFYGSHFTRHCSTPHYRYAVWFSFGFTCGSGSRFAAVYWLRVYGFAFCATFHTFTHAHAFALHVYRYTYCAHTVLHRTRVPAVATTCVYTTFAVAVCFGSGSPRFTFRIPQFGSYAVLPFYRLRACAALRFRFAYTGFWFGCRTFHGLHHCRLVRTLRCTRLPPRCVVATAAFSRRFYAARFVLHTRLPALPPGYRAARCYGYRCTAYRTVTAGVWTHVARLRTTAFGYARVLRFCYPTPHHHHVHHHYVHGCCIPLHTVAAFAGSRLDYRCIYRLHVLVVRGSRFAVCVHTCHHTCHARTFYHPRLVTTVARYAHVTHTVTTHGSTFTVPVRGSGVFTATRLVCGSHSFGFRGLVRAVYCATRFTHTYTYVTVTFVACVLVCVYGCTRAVPAVWLPHAHCVAVLRVYARGLGLPFCGHVWLRSACFAARGFAWVCVLHHVRLRFFATVCRLHALRITTHVTHVLGFVYIHAPTRLLHTTRYRTFAADTTYAVRVVRSAAMRGLG